jgi:hypothetical protein
LLDGKQDHPYTFEYLKRNEALSDANDSKHQLTYIQNIGQAYISENPNGQERAAAEILQGIKQDDEILPKILAALEKMPLNSSGPLFQSIRDFIKIYHPTVYDHFLSLTENRNNDIHSLETQKNKLIKSVDKIRRKLSPLQKQIYLKEKNPENFTHAKLSPIKKVKCSKDSIQEKLINKTNIETLPKLNKELTELYPKQRSYLFQINENNKTIDEITDRINELEAQQTQQYKDLFGLFTDKERLEFAVKVELGQDLNKYGPIINQPPPPNQSEYKNKPQKTKPCKKNNSFKNASILSGIMSAIILVCDLSIYATETKTHNPFQLERHLVQSIDAYLFWIGICFLGICIISTIFACCQKRDITSNHENPDDNNVAERSLKQS